MSDEYTPIDYADWLRQKIRIYEAAEWAEDAQRTREQLAELLHNRAAEAERNTNPR